MKKYFSILTAAVLMLFSFSAKAQFITTPVLLTAITNLSGVISSTNVFVIGAVNAASVTNIASPATNAGPRLVSIPPGQGVGFFTTLGTTNLGTAHNVTFIFETTVDGTNFTTGTNFSYALALNGMTRVAGFTNINATTLNNARGIRIRQIFNDNTNVTYITNCYFTRYQ
jgi:hypothetical protein